VTLRVVPSQLAGRRAGDGAGSCAATLAVPPNHGGSSRHAQHCTAGRMQAMRRVGRPMTRPAALAAAGAGAAAPGPALQRCAPRVPAADWGPGRPTARRPAAAGCRNRYHRPLADPHMQTRHRAGCRRGARLVVAVGAEAVEHAAVRGHAVEAAEAGLAELQERGGREQRVRARLRPRAAPSGARRRGRAGRRHPGSALAVAGRARRRAAGAAGRPWQPTPVFALAAAAGRAAPLQAAASLTPV
jgi:hypothetical protein